MRILGNKYGIPVGEKELEYVNFFKDLTGIDVRYELRERQDDLGTIEEELINKIKENFKQFKNHKDYKWFEDFLLNSELTDYMIVFFILYWYEHFNNKNKRLKTELLGVVFEEVLRDDATNEVYNFERFEELKQLLEGKSVGLVELDIEFEPYNEEYSTVHVNVTKPKTEIVLDVEYLDMADRGEELMSAYYTNKVMKTISETQEYDKVLVDSLQYLGYKLINYDEDRIYVDMRDIVYEIKHTINLINNEEDWYNYVKDGNKVSRWWV